VLLLFNQTPVRNIIDTHQRLAADLAELQSTILPRLQRVELDLIHAKLDRFFAELHIAIQLRARQGLEAAEAVERGFRAMLAPLPRGSAGGLARARTAWRYLDGTFMPESEKEAAYLEEYERYAKGDRARSATAIRASDGTFLRTHDAHG
jgi:hypothetical protein